MVSEIRTILGPGKLLCSSVLERVLQSYHKNLSFILLYGVELLKIEYVDVYISLLSDHIYIQHKISPERTLNSSLSSLPRGIMMELFYPYLLYLFVGCFIACSPRLSYLPELVLDLFHFPV